MGRNLHITITGLCDGDNDRRQEQSFSRATPFGPGKLGDPEEDDLLSTGEDPTSPGFPEGGVGDPEEDDLLSTGEDPNGPAQGGSFPSDHAAACPPSGNTTETTIPSGGASLPAFPRQKLEYSGLIVVRLAKGQPPETNQTLYQFAEQQGLYGVTKALAQDSPKDPGVQPNSLQAPFPETRRILGSRPLIRNEKLGGESLYEWLLRCEQRAQTTPFPPLHSLLSYWLIDARNIQEQIGSLLKGLNSLPEVDLAYRQLAATDPTDNSAQGEYRDEQSYLEDAPLGIGARWAVAQLPSGVGKIRLVDIEQRWLLDHQELNTQPITILHGENRAEEAMEDGFHGTAVLAQLTAGLALEGIASKIAELHVASHFQKEDYTTWHNPDGDGPPKKLNGHVAEAIAHALAKKLVEGDVLLLEVQRSRLPTEVDPADFDAIRLASALQIITVEAAGNGGFNLDAWVGERGAVETFNRAAPRFRDSGAIMVGAARSYQPHNRWGFSNFGSRLDCWCWGDSVLTAGYGDFDDGFDGSSNIPEKMYTNTFSGTSSASPCIAGAVALVQCFFLELQDDPALPLRMRELISNRANGTPQGPDVHGNIGVMPDLKAILQRGTGLLADLYMRRATSDDGSGTIVQQLTSSCPDIFFVAAQQKALKPVDLGDPAPDLSIGTDALLCVRVWNRGLSKGTDVGIHVYSSPVTTIITPLLWESIDRHSSKADIPPGHSYRIIEFSPSTLNTYQTFLTILEHRGPGLVAAPKLPPWSDWNSFKAFLLDGSVACRNTHRVVINTPYEFRIAGAPDQTRTFDLEILQCLPKGYQVQFTFPKILALRLRRQFSWVERNGTSLVPEGARWVFRNVRLPANTCYLSELTCYQLDQAIPLEPGIHHVVLRQLNRGEEIGRITWYFKGENGS
jgi:hypothetical protein